MNQETEIVVLPNKVYLVVSCPQRELITMLVTGAKMLSRFAYSLVLIAEESLTKFHTRSNIKVILFIV